MELKGADSSQIPVTMESSELTDVEIPSSSSTEVGNLENVDAEYGKDPIEKRLTLTFKNLTVRVEASDQALGETLLSRVDPREWGRQLFRGRYDPARSRVSL